MIGTRLSTLSYPKLINRFENRLEHKECDRPPEDISNYFPSAVMILFVWADNVWNILYTQRTDKVRDHKNQVSFPGGAWETTDKCLKDTALRETYEELGIRPKDIQVFGSLPPEYTITGYYLVPYIGILTWPYQFKLQTDEVESVFILPIKWLLQDGIHEEREFYNAERNITRRTTFFKERDGYILWGITAMLTIKLLNILK